MKHFSLVLIMSVIVISSCGKKGNTGSSDIAPTDLVINATVSNDSSGNVSFAEFTFDFDMKDGSKILWHEIIRSVWENGLIVEEQYFKS